MESANVIGIDIGGSSLKCGLVKKNGNIIYSTQIPITNTKTGRNIVDIVSNAIGRCMRESKTKVSGVGIGFPGITENGVIIGGGINLPGSKGLPLGQILTDRLKQLVIVGNDASMMALGEMAFGSAQNYEDVIFLTVGTGIGGAILVNKKVLGGYRERGGELGHIIIQKDGKTCACGAKGCFEAYASTKALTQSYNDSEAKTAPANGEMIVKRYLQGEHKAVSAMENHFDYMATGIAGLVNVFSPQCVIIGGGISEAGAFYIDEISRRVNAIAIPVSRQFLTIKAASLGNAAGLLGCAAKVFQSITN